MGRTKRHFKGKHVVVTGAASGIGKKTAERLLGYGARVLAVDLSKESLATFVEEANTEDLIAYECDLTAVAPEEFVDNCYEKLGGKLDVFHHNAGVCIIDPLNSKQSTSAAFEKMIEINLTNPILVTKAILNGLDRHPERIPTSGTFDMLYTASLSAHVAPPNMAVYAATKAGIYQFSRTLKREADMGFYACKVNVCTLQPGIVRTGIVSEDVVEASKSMVNYSVDTVVLKLLNSTAAGEFNAVINFRDSFGIWLERLAPSIVFAGLKKKYKEKKEQNISLTGRSKIIDDL